MQEVTENIWRFSNEEEWIIICTNGTINEDGSAYLKDEKISLQADIVYMLSDILGGLIKEKGNIPHVLNINKSKIITLPIKEYYDSEINLDMIKINLDIINKIMKDLKISKIYLAQPEVSDKKKWKKEIRPFFKKLLDDKFIMVAR
jgi:hypothetical protein